MKKVVSGEQLTTKMTEAVHLMSDTVASTLGPKGRNVIIDHSAFQPFITNDGVTIAENIESDDEILQTILTLTKEASIHTNHCVGDGTTSTLVLLKAIFDKGLEYIQNGINPMVLKRELDKSLVEIKKLILEKSRKPTKEELIQIAKISANDDEIGSIVSEAYFKVGNRFGIQLSEHDKPNTTLIHTKGYTMTSLLASPYFIEDEGIRKLENAYLLLNQGVIEEIEEIASILNMIIKEKKPLIIVSEDYSDALVQDILSFKLETNSDVFLLKNPEYGIKQREILKDLASLSNANIMNDSKEGSYKDLGIVKKITLTKKEITFSIQKMLDVTKRRKEIEKQIKESANELDLEWNQKRYNSFQKGLIEIQIGAPTTTERREKKMRYEDALCAIDASSFGILPGSGIVFLELSQKIPNNTIGFRVFINALKKPFLQILENAGIESKKIQEHIQKNNFSYLYNVLTEEYEDIAKTKVVDATKVLLESLTNAVSIATMLMTTNHLVINEVQNERNKTNDFNEM